MQDRWKNSLPFILGIVLSLASPTPLTARNERFLDLEIPVHKKRLVIVGAIVQEGPRYHAYTVGFTIPKVKIKKNKAKLKILQRGVPLLSDMVTPIKPVRFTTHWSLTDFQFEIFSIQKHLVVGRLSVPGDVPGKWRVLSMAKPDSESLEGIEEPVLVKSTTTNYPQSALDARIYGAVLLRAVLGEDGELQPDTVGIIQAIGHGCEEAAIETILNEWVFKPARKDGRSISRLITIEVNFTLR